MKDLPFSFCTTYIGFKWNLSMTQVSVGEKKKTKHLDSISEWTKNFTHPLSDIQKLYRKLLHICLIIPREQAYLTKLEAMLCTGSDRPFMSYSKPKGLREDSNGGQASSNNWSSLNQSPDPYHFMMLGHWNCNCYQGALESMASHPQMENTQWQQGHQLGQGHWI